MRRLLSSTARGMAPATPQYLLNTYNWAYVSERNAPLLDRPEVGARNPRPRRRAI